MEIPESGIQVRHLKHTTMEISIRQATAADTIFIAKGFHAAMLAENVSDKQIEAFSSKICSRTDTLYSWKNTFIAEEDKTPVGMVTCYDGSKYREMRAVTMDLVKTYLNTEFPGMEDETGEGEFYVDSLAVIPSMRGNGIGRLLLRYAIDKGHELGLDVTLAVDPVNTNARRMYESIGFRYYNTVFIFGHDYDKMKV